MKNKEQLIQEGEYTFPYHYIPQHTNNFTQTYNWTWGIKYVSAIEFLIKKMKECDFKTIADIGTGDGRLVKEISENFKDKEIIGIDYSEKAINLAKAMNPSLRFINTNILADNSEKKFDLLTLVEVFEHIPLDICDEFSLALKNLLNEKGILLITVPHKNKPLNEKHFQHFNIDSIKKYFSKHFLIEEVIYFDKQTKISKIINLLLTNKLFILNNKSLKNLLYTLYKKKCFIANENNCNRMFIKLKKI